MTVDRRRLLGSGLVALTTSLVSVPTRAQSVQYAYDVFGRVVRVTYPNGAVTIYGYDAANNRSVVFTGSTPPPAPAASVSPTSVEGGISFDAGPATASASGGLGPYTYRWEQVSGNPSTFAIDPNSNSTQWQYTGTPVGPPKVSYWRCKVTDAANGVAYTGQVMVRMLME